MDEQILVDAVRFAHLFSVAVGIGASFLADSLVLSNLNKPVWPTMLDRLHHCHRLVSVSLVFIWITGAAMIYIRTGFELAEFSPKLFSKLGVVSMLTLNAIVIGRYAMPMLKRNQGRALLDMPLGRKFACSWVGAISSASWMTALAMGQSKVLAESGWSVFVLLVPLAYLSSIFLASLAVTVLHIRPTKISVVAAE